MGQEEPEDLLPKRQRGIAVEFDRAQRTAFPNLLAMMPRTHHQKYFVVVRVLRLDRFVHRDIAIDVFLVPETVHQHHWHFQRLLCQDLVDGLFTPERIIARMLEQLPPEPDLLQLTPPSQLAR